MSSSVKFTIQKADPDLHSKDLEALIQELADYERMPQAPKLKSEQIQHDLKNGYCYAYVATMTEAYEQWPSGSIVGYLLYYYAYSTWEGRYLFIEDIYVKPELRRFGIGSALWDTATKIAFQDGLQRVEWNVLTWNETAIQFYNRMGAIDLYKQENWVRFRLDRTQIEKLASSL